MTGFVVQGHISFKTFETRITFFLLCNKTGDYFIQ